MSAHVCMMHNLILYASYYDMQAAGLRRAAASRLRVLGAADLAFHGCEAGTQVVEWLGQRGPQVLSRLCAGGAVVIA